MRISNAHSLRARGYLRCKRRKKNEEKKGQKIRTLNVCERWKSRILWCIHLCVTLTAPTLHLRTFSYFLSLLTLNGDATSVTTPSSSASFFGWKTSYWCAFVLVLRLGERLPNWNDSCYVLCVASASVEEKNGCDLFIFFFFAETRVWKPKFWTQHQSPAKWFFVVFVFPIALAYNEFRRHSHQGKLYSLQLLQFIFKFQIRNQLLNGSDELLSVRTKCNGHFVLICAMIKCHLRSPTSDSDVLRALDRNGNSNCNKSLISADCPRYRFDVRFRR